MVSQDLTVWSTVPHPARTSTSGFDVTVPTDMAALIARCDRELRSLGAQR
jgi:hypothetical protein